MEYDDPAINSTFSACVDFSFCDPLPIICFNVIGYTSFQMAQARYIILHYESSLFIVRVTTREISDDISQLSHTLLGMPVTTDHVQWITIKMADEESAMKISNIALIRLVRFLYFHVM